MSDDCCGAAAGSAEDLNDARWRRIVWIALWLNAAMFFVESISGVLARSRSLQADSLDFLGDASNYAISLGVAGMALAWRARAALVKGVTILVFGCGVLASAIWGFLHQATPEPLAMGVVGSLALVVNVAVAAMLYRYRTGDANMVSVWICSRNDAISNLLVILAGFTVAATGSAWPDLAVAAVMALLGISGGWRIVRQARGELRAPAAGATTP